MCQGRNSRGWICPGTKRSRVHRCGGRPWLPLVLSSPVHTPMEALACLFPRTGQHRWVSRIWPSWDWSVLLGSLVNSQALPQAHSGPSNAGLRLRLAFLPLRPLCCDQDGAYFFFSGRLWRFWPSVATESPCAVRECFANAGANYVLFILCPSCSHKSLYLMLGERRLFGF